MKTFFARKTARCRLIFYFQMNWVFQKKRRKSRGCWKIENHFSYVVRRELLFVWVGSGVGVFKHLCDPPPTKYFWMTIIHHQFLHLCTQWHKKQHSPLTCIWKIYFRHSLSHVNLLLFFWGKLMRMYYNNELLNQEKKLWRKSRLAMKRRRSLKI